MLTEEQKVELKELVFIEYHVIRLINLTRAKVLLSWTGFGIADVNDSPNKHEVTVEENSVVMSGFPLVLNDDAAYLQRYSVEIDNWDPTKSHLVQLTINDTFVKTLTIPAVKNASSFSNPIPFRPSDVQVNIGNVEDGIDIDLRACHPDFKNKVKNIVIKRGVNGGGLVVEYQSSVPVPFSLSTNELDYSFINKGGVKKSAFTAGEFNDIYTNREKFVGRVIYQDSEGDYIEETNLNIIANFDSNNIVSTPTLANLDPSVDNEFDYLYLTVDEEKYYRYRPQIRLAPFQSLTFNPNQLTKYIPLDDIDGDSDGNFDLYVDGTVLGLTNIFINGSVKRENGDFTSFDDRTIITLPLVLYLPVGVEFMDTFTGHIDTDVVEGNFYTYEVEIQLWNGETHLIFTGIKKREAPNKDTIATAGLKISELEESIVGDASLSEYDFQSGVSHHGLKVFLSSDLKDLKDFTRNKKVEEDCKCRLL